MPSRHRHPLLALLLLCLAPLLSAQSTPRRSVAVTVDDLPAMDAADLSAAEITSINRRLLGTLAARHIPAIGFVIEQPLYTPGEVDRRIAVLQAWLDAGLDLGNHTFSHSSLNHTALQDWEDDVVTGETVTRMLLRAHGRKPIRYLRHPYLDVGPDLNTRRAAEAFLTARGYRVAPVTLDPRDWFFADLYDDARAHHDAALERRLTAAFLAYADQVFTYQEQRSQQLLGYEPRQILLIHDTALEADHLGDLLDLLARHGYSFISLDSALTDPAYAQPDTYISDVGTSWIQHWAVTRGHPDPPDAAPAIPAWVEQLHAAFDKAHPDN